MFGHVPGFPVGSEFEDRRDLAASGVHRPPMAGICGTADGGAESVVLAGGYVDDEDHGDTVVYTGAGGNDRKTKQQTGHQTLHGVNAALDTSRRRGLPVRVVRGRPRPSVLKEYPHVVFAPPQSGYRYDGLYLVTDCWPDVGADGFRVWRFRLERLPEDGAVLGRVSEALPLFGSETPERREGLVSRVLRDPTVTQYVKRIHGYRCQVCGLVVDTPAGPYAEAAHIWPLGRPHDGPDVPENVLCLCPNHHVAFDRWAFALSDSLTLVGLPGRIQTVDGHAVDRSAVEYHRALYEAARAA